MNAASREPLLQSTELSAQQPERREGGARHTASPFAGRARKNTESPIKICSVLSGVPKPRTEDLVNVAAPSSAPTGLDCHRCLLKKQSNFCFLVGMENRFYKYEEKQAGSNCRVFHTSSA